MRNLQKVSTKRGRLRNTATRARFLFNGLHVAGVVGVDDGELLVPPAAQVGPYVHTGLSQVQPDAGQGGGWTNVTE